jgi:branched-chain amino acid transport system ATP-binding protein
MKKEVILYTREVSKYFGGIRALENVSISIYEKEILGIMGPNGSGKTTLINVITGYIKPDKGRIYMRDKDITGLPPYSIAKLGIVRTFQIPRPFREMSVIDNVIISVMHGKGFKNENEIYKEALRVLEEVGLYDRRNLKAKDLSDIEKKRLELAKGLAAEPKVLMLDEVMAGARGEEVENLIRIIRKAGERGITIIAVEHIVSALTRLADRIIVLDQGRVLTEGRPEEVINNPLVKKAYLGEI